jgi:hypothetical protein
MAQDYQQFFTKTVIFGQFVKKESEYCSISYSDYEVHTILQMQNHQRIQPGKHAPDSVHA